MRAQTELTLAEAERLRDFLTSRLPPKIKPMDDVGRAAMAVEAARREGKQ